MLWFLAWGSSTGELKVTVRAAARLSLKQSSGTAAGQERKCVASSVWYQVESSVDWLILRVSMQR